MLENTWSWFEVIVASCTETTKRDSLCGMQNEVEGYQGKTHSTMKMLVFANDFTQLYNQNSR